MLSGMKIQINFGDDLFFLKGDISPLPSGNAQTLKVKKHKSKHHTKEHKPL